MFFVREMVGIARFELCLARACFPWGWYTVGRGSAFKFKNPAVFPLFPAFSVFTDD